MSGSNRDSNSNSSSSSSSNNTANNFTDNDDNEQVTRNERPRDELKDGGQGGHISEGSIVVSAG